MATPSLVIASRISKCEVKKVATHASPSELAKSYFPNAQLVIAKSNSDAADMLLKDEVDACLTTMRCVEEHSLNIIHDFGAIAMGWNVFKRKNN